VPATQSLHAVIPVFDEGSIAATRKCTTEADGAASSVYRLFVQGTVAESKGLRGERDRPREARLERAHVARLPEDRRRGRGERIGDEDLDRDADAVAHGQVARRAPRADVLPPEWELLRLPGAIGHPGGG